MKTLILTVGLPRSGKSTWANSTGLPMVNPDSIRLAFHGQAHLPSAEPMVWTMAKYMVKSLFIAGHDQVIMDATSLDLKRIDEWHSRDWHIQFALFNAPPEVCIERAIAGKRDDLVPVIRRMATRLSTLANLRAMGPNHIHRDDIELWRPHGQR